MTQLANANLLDDSVANSSSLKNDRLNKTAQRAVNPQPIKEDVEEEIEDDDDNEIAEKNTSLSKFESKKSLRMDREEKEDNKILGMKPILFYGIVATVAVVGGLLIYNKFFKNKKLGSVGNLDVKSVTPTTPNV